MVDGQELVPRCKDGRAAARADWFRPRRRQRAYLAAHAANRLEEGSCIRPAPAGRSRGRTAVGRSCRDRARRESRPSSSTRVRPVRGSAPEGQLAHQQHPHPAGGHRPVTEPLVPWPGWSVRRSRCRWHTRAAARGIRRAGTRTSRDLGPVSGWGSAAPCGPRRDTGACVGHHRIARARRRPRPALV